MRLSDDGDSEGNCSGVGQGRGWGTGGWWNAVSCVLMSNASIVVRIID